MLKLFVVIPFLQAHKVRDIRCTGTFSAPPTSDSFVSKVDSDLELSRMGLKDMAGSNVPQDSTFADKEDAKEAKKDVDEPAMLDAGNDALTRSRRRSALTS